MGLVDDQRVAVQLYSSKEENLSEVLGRQPFRWETFQELRRLWKACLQYVTSRYGRSTLPVRSVVVRRLPTAPGVASQCLDRKLHLCVTDSW